MKFLIHVRIWPSDNSGKTRSLKLDEAFETGSKDEAIQRIRSMISSVNGEYDNLTGFDLKAWVEFDPSALLRNRARLINPVWRLRIVDGIPVSTWS